MVRTSIISRSRCPFLILLSFIFAVCVNAFIPNVRAPIYTTSTTKKAIDWTKRNGGGSLVRRQSQVQERPTTTSTNNPNSSGGGGGGNPYAGKEGEEELKVPLDLLPPSAFPSLPWSHSITGDGPETLLYMPFVEEQLRHLRSIGPFSEVSIPSNVAYQRAEKKTAHMASFCVESEDFRKIRFTYMDGGKSVQVFNSVWYPRFDSDAPLLGVDLLLFGGHRMLAVVDFQPLSKDEDYKAKYINHLSSIKAKYPALSDTISNRYYEDTRWFSDNMLFGRLQDIGQIQTTLMSAFQEYLVAYTDVVKASRRQQPQGGEVGPSEDYVKARHRDYDEYNLVRDPAGKLFESYFGKDFAHGMLSFLFEMADPALLATHGGHP